MLTAIVAGSATSALVGPVAALTTYSVTVTGRGDAAGRSSVQTVPGTTLAAAVALDDATVLVPGT